MTQSAFVSLFEDIAEANKVFMAAFAQADAAGLAALYTEEGQILPPNGDFVTGREEIEAFWGAIFGMGIKKAELDLGEVESFGETAVEVSRFTMLGESGQVLDKGKYIVIWKHEENQWKLHRDIFNSSMPPPG